MGAYGDIIAPGEFSMSQQCAGRQLNAHRYAVCILCGKKTECLYPYRHTKIAPHICFNCPVPYKVALHRKAVAWRRLKK